MSSLSLLPYQQQGVEYLMGQTACVLGDDPGLGKTAQAITAAVRLALRDPQIEGGGVLIICPASLRLNWLREWEMWARLEAGDAYECLPEPVVLSYEKARTSPATFAKTWGVAIFDEAHYLKSRKAQRTKKLLGVVSVRGGKAKITGGVSAHHTWYLTGTPVTTCPANFFTLLQRTRPHAFPSRHWYETRYCDGHMGNFGWQATGASCVGELRRTICESGVMCRRLKKDVLTQLPPKRRQVLEIPRGVLSTEGKQAVDESRKAFSRLLQDMQISETALETDAALFDRVMSQMRVTRKSTAQVGCDEDEDRHSLTTHDLRRMLAPAKVEALMALMDDAKETGEKVVVWCAYHFTVDAVMAGLEERGISAVKYTGRESEQARDEAVRAFQAGTVQVFVATSAGYTGLTLTAAAREIFVEASWVPAENAQAEDRCFRIGQKNPVLVQYLVVEGSYDVRLMQVMVERMQTISTLLDGASA